MEWLYFDLIRVASGYYLLDVEYQIPLEENGQVKIFSSYAEAELYLEDNGIRGSIRDVVA